jgi:hypothetical protein
MSATLKFGNGQWATKVGSTLAYNDEGGNFKPLPFNFTRSTGGTRVNKDGLIEVITNNKPRIDFLNDSNGALLLEPSRTNSLPYSNDFNNAAWQKIGSSTITANTLISPDGTLNASTFKASSNSYGCILRQLYYGFNYVSPYASSFYVKKKNHRYIGLRLGNLIGPSDTYNFFDFDTETVNNTIAPSAALSFTKLTNGWYKLSVVGTPISGEVVDLALTQSNGSTINPAGTEEVYVYGSQLEQGSYATSYIPTQGATAGVTRVAEVCNQTPPSGIIGQTEGTIFAHFKRNGNIVSRGGVVFLREDFLRGLSINYINNTLYAISRNDAATTTVVLKTPFDINETAKVAITYNGSVFSGFLNGVKIFTDSVFNPFDTIVTEIRVSYGANSGSDIEIAPNSMKDVRVYTTVLTDQECINLTTL